jgi:hypothetical protein
VLFQKMARKPSVSPKSSSASLPTKPFPATRARSFDELREALMKRGTHSSLVEECLRFPFIDYGYRDTKSFRDTFFTLFSFHNETMNIWSHLIGFFCVLVAGYHVAAEMMSTKDLHIFEMIAFETFIVCAALCLLLSAVYHWFGCISEAYHNCLLRVDITGVGLLVAGSYFPAVYYGMENFFIAYLVKIYLVVNCPVVRVLLLAGHSNGPLRVDDIDPLCRHGRTLGGLQDQRLRRAAVSVGFVGVYRRDPLRPMALHHARCLSQRGHQGE